MSRQLTQEQFIIKANQTHNNKYNYSKTIYTKAKNKIIITCPIHGDFEQIASEHLFYFQGNDLPTEKLFSFLQAVS